MEPSATPSPFAATRVLRAALPAKAPDAAELRVVRQLVEALLFERLVPYDCRPRDAQLEPDVEAVYDTLVDFSVGDRRACCLAAIASWSRVRVAERSIAWTGEETAGPCRLDELIASLALEPESRRRLHDELIQTVELSRWNREHLPHQRAPRRQLGFQQLESAIVEGHQYHPSFKTRTGFTLQDHQDYGSETGNEFQLLWLAITKTALRSALPCAEESFWKRELGELEYALLTERLAQRGGSWADRSLVPIHPWQLRAVGTSGLARAIETHDIIPLGPAGDRYHASQSLRTLVNASDPTKANVKLPLDIICTSSHRNLEKNFVCTAPALSDWLASLVENDSFLQDGPRLSLLKEYAGIIYLSDDEALEGRVGVIYRESVCDMLRAGEAAVPFTALTLVESDGRPFIADWLDTYGVERWVDRLIAVALLPLWHMLVHHGIAFEAHAQNLILVHRDGWPLQIVLRDFHEDTEFVPDYLSAPEQVPAFERIDAYFETIPDDEGYRMASIDALRQLFMDTVYVYNLADVSFLVARYFQYHESSFWSLVRKHLSAYQASGITDSARIEQIACDCDESVVESLLTKKIKDGGVLDYFEHTIQNTLRG